MDEPAPVRVGLLGWVRASLRGFFLCAILLLGVSLTVVIRLIEKPFFGLRRPITPYITQGVCRLALVIIGLRHQTIGQPMTRPGAIVSNHASWLDIFVLNARKRIYFVSKSEVAGWPGIGILARLTGTVFIVRDPKQAKSQTELFEKRLLVGHKLLFFPEGTSTDGKRVLPFKSTLFQSFFAHELRHKMHIQPISVQYHAPKNQDPRFYGWWGDMDLGPHLIKLLAARHHGSVTVSYHPPVKIDEFTDRKALAADLEARVRSGMDPTPDPGPAPSQKPG